MNPHEEWVGIMYIQFVNSPQEEVIPIEKVIELYGIGYLLVDSTGTQYNFNNIISIRKAEV